MPEIAVTFRTLLAIFFRWPGNSVGLLISFKNCDFPYGSVDLIIRFHAIYAPFLDKVLEERERKLYLYDTA